MRLLENGRLEEAAKEKSRLEERQRHARKVRESSNIEHKPMWFVPVGAKENHEWVSRRRNYWDRSWEQCPRLFACELLHTEDAKKAKKFSLQRKRKKAE